MRKKYIIGLAVGFAFSVGADPLTLLNPGFDGPHDSDPPEWGVVESYNQSIYTWDDTVSPEPVLAFKDPGGGDRIEQNLTANNPSFTAGSTGQWTVGFDYGWRTSTEGSDGIYTVSLIELASGATLASTTLILPVDGTYNTYNQLGTADLPLNYDNSTVTAGSTVALRIERTDATDEGITWESTTFIDNITVSATLTPQPDTPPSIITPPQDAIAIEGGSHTFTLSASGSQPMAYQWLKGGSNLIGETSSMLNLQNLTLADSDDYSVWVTNAFGSVTSTVAMLTVVIDEQDSDNDGLPTDWELANGLDPFDDGSIHPDNGAWGDPDGDGLPNDEEYFLNSNPQLNESGKAWKSRPEKTRLMVINAHPDDEGIFFGGVIPYYTQVRQLPTICISMTSGDWNRVPEIREAEYRDATWSYGLRNQPIFPRFRDYPTSTVNETWDVWADGELDGQGVAEGRVLAGETLAYWIRRYRPDVVITHGFDGEYGHSNHKATALATADAYDIAADPSVNLGGLPVWQVKKLYINNYGANPLFHEEWQNVSIDSDEDGTPDQTPIDVANIGLSFHASQGSHTVSTCYANDETNSGFEPFPCEWWGLYATAVGYDTIASDFTAPDPDNIPTTYSGWARGDFFENLTAFPDSDYDEMADAWELDHFISLAAAVPHADGEGDGYSNLDEFTAGLNPVLADGLDFAIDATQPAVIFTVPPATGTGYEGLIRRYQLLHSPDLENWDSVVAEGPAGDPITYPIPEGPQYGFYRLMIILE